jgi:hypothetical protein
MNNPDARFAIIEIPPGPSPPEAIVVGNMDAVMRCLPQTVASEEQEQRLALAEKQAAETARKQQEARTCAARMLADGLRHLSNRLDTFEARKKAHADQLRRDAEEAEAKAIAEYLNSLPDPDALDAESDYSLTPPSPYRDPTSIGGP